MFPYLVLFPVWSGRRCKKDPPTLLPSWNSIIVILMSEYVLLFLSGFLYYSAYTWFTYTCLYHHSNKLAIPEGIYVAQVYDHSFNLRSRKLCLRQNPTQAFKIEPAQSWAHLWLCRHGVTFSKYAQIQVWKNPDLCDLHTDVTHILPSQVKYVLQQSYLVLAKVNFTPLQTR